MYFARHVWIFQIVLTTALADVRPTARMTDATSTTLIAPTDVKPVTMAIAVHKVRCYGVCDLEPFHCVQQILTWKLRATNKNQTERDLKNTYKLKWIFIR